MARQLPIIYSAHHASHNFGTFSARVALADEEKIRYSDYGSAVTVPKNGTLTLTAEYSRGIIDLNRNPKHEEIFPTYDFARPMPNRIWSKGYELSPSERKNILKEIRDRYHNRIHRALSTLTKPGVVVGWDNTAHYEIGVDDTGSSQIMKPFILSNGGRDGDTDVSRDERLKGRRPTCDPAFLSEVVKRLRPALKKAGFPADVYLNHVFKGGYIIDRYTTLRHKELTFPLPIQSFQVEYDTLLTHDQKTLKPDNRAMEKLRYAFEEAIGLAYRSYFEY